MDEWISKLWYIHTMEYYSGLEKGNSAVSYNMDETRRHEMLSEISWFTKRHMLCDSTHSRYLE